MEGDDGVVADAREVVTIEEAAALAERRDISPFTEAERAYASAVSDPARRLAARLAAKRAAARLLGAGITAHEIEVYRPRGAPPKLRLSPRAQARLRHLGAARTLVSLTHGRTHAAASVLFLRDVR